MGCTDHTARLAAGLRSRWLPTCLLSVLAMLPLCQAWAQPHAPGMPSIRIDWHRDTALCDHLLLTTERFVLPATLPSTATILDRRGEIAWYCPLEDNAYALGLQPDGSLTLNVNDTWYALDSGMNPTPLTTCGGMLGDFHDFMRLANGHQLELCIADTLLDLSAFHTYSGQAGDSNATVQYAVVQERDASGAVLRRWRGTDHFGPADVDSLYFFYPWLLDLNHANSLDYDGQHVLVSHRNNHAVTLIDWATGDVVWQLGGVRSDFYFLGDYGFGSQHDARFAGPGRVTLLDNRSLLNEPPRAVAYTLDTALGLAIMAYAHVQPGLESRSMGSYQELPTGEGVASWGTIDPTGGASVSYFQRDGSRLCDIVLEDDHHAYRAECATLPFTLRRPSVTCERTGDSLWLHATAPHGSYLWSNGATTPDILVSDTGMYQLYVPLGMGFAGSNVIHIQDLDAACPSTGAAHPAAAPSRPPKCIARLDLLGRPLTVPAPHQIYLELYDDGSSRKLLHLTR